MYEEQFAKFEARRLEIRSMLEGAEEVDLDALQTELRDMEAEEKKLRARMTVVESLKGNPPQVTRTIETPNQKPEEKKKFTATEEYRSAYEAYLRYGPSGMTPEEKTALSSGRSVLTERELRAQSAVTGGAGGYTVPTGFFNELEKALKDFGGMREAARIISTTAGNDLPMPSANDTAVVGELVAENAAVAAPADVSFGQIIMKAYKYSSKPVLVPLELLQDSAFDVESEIISMLAERIFRITNTHFTTGTGTGQPQGVVAGATLGKAGATGQTLTVKYEDLIDLEHSVNAAYRRRGAIWMFNDLTLAALKKMVVGTTDARPLWTAGVAYNAPPTLLGYPYIVNNDVATMAANAKSILFGDFSKYIIRSVLDVTLFRMSEKYIENGQVGFLCFYRTDGRVRDAGTNPIKYYANSAT